MKVSAGTWLGLVCCLLAVARCIGNPLSETHHPFAIESEETEEHLVQPIDSEEGQGSEEYAPPRLLQSHGPNNLQQSNEEKASERRLTVHEGREEDRQSNRTSGHHNISQGVTPNAEDLSAITVSSSSTNPQGHRNVISIIRNDTDSNLQVEIHGHSDSNRDQSSNLNFAPQEQQEELDSIVKRTVMPALLPEIQNGSLPLEIPNPETPGEGRPSQSDILHENNTNLEGQLMNEINTFQNTTSSTAPSSVEALNSNRLLPDTDQDSVNIVEPGIETETNITESNNATEGSHVDKHGGSNVATEAVPLATIQIPEEKPDTESSGFSNDTEENENAMSTTSRPQAITKENKYRTKGEIPEMTIPDKDEYHPGLMEPYTFPQTPPTTKYFTFSRTLSNENMTQSTTQKSREEVAATTVSSRESGIRSTYSTRLPEPTEQIVSIRTTLPQERVPTERFLSTIISSSRFHSTSMISSEVIRETGTAPPPSERVPEVTIRFPTEAINPEPTEPIFKTTTRVNVVTESGTEGSGRTHYPDETVPQVTLRFPTEPMEAPLTTALPATETVDLNGKSSTQSEYITEIIGDKITKGVPELNTTSSSNEEKFTVTILNMTRSGSEGVSITRSNSESERTHSSTVNNFPDINSTLSSIQVSTGLSSPSHPTINYNTHTNSRTVSITSTAFSGSENSTNYDRPMTHYSTTGSTESYNTSDQRATIYTTGLSSASSTQQAVFSSTRESTKDDGEPPQHVTSMENITVNSMLETTPRVSGSTSQRQTTPPNVNITASQSTTSIRNSTFTTPTSSARHNVTTGRPHVTSRPTTKKQRTNSPTTKKPTETPKATEKPNDVFTTALVFPPVYISMQFQWSLNGFCSIESTFIKDLTEIIRRKMNKKFEETQIKFINQLCSETATETRIDSVGKVDDLTIKIVTVYLYVTDDKGKIDAKLTVESSEFLRTGLKSQSRYDQKLLNVQLINLDNSRKDYQEKGLSSGMTIAVIIVIVGGICCVCLIVLQILMHKRNEKVSRNILPGSNRFSLRSLDSIALNAVPKSRPHSGFWNPGLDHSEENISSASNPLGFNSLSNMTRDMVEIYKEFEKLPNEMPSLSCVPMGAEDKNRFANVIPFSHSRVKLKKLPHEEHSDYINANFITGYNGDVHAYIATQAPLTNTITDFWRMIWEQQSRVIIMLMAVNETKQPRDPAYVPDTEGVNGRVRYGDIVLVLKKKEVRQEYIMSLLEVKDIENNLMREVRHFWFTSWPVDSIPEPISVIKLILDTRVHYEDSGAPLVVHCSSGTGRSGTMIAIDICMRSYESKRVVDILGCVSNMRRERAGLVQNKEQYALIYKTLNEYAVIMGSPRLAQSSSSAIQLQHML